MCLISFFVYNFYFLDCISQQNKILNREFLRPGAHLLFTDFQNNYPEINIRFGIWIFFFNETYKRRYDATFDRATVWHVTDRRHAWHCQRSWSITSLFTWQQCPDTCCHICHFPLELYPFVSGTINVRCNWHKTARDSSNNKILLEITRKFSE